MWKRLKEDAPFVSLVMVYINIVFLIFGLPAAWDNPVKLGIWVIAYGVFMLVFFKFILWAYRHNPTDDDN